MALINAHPVAELDEDGHPTGRSLGYVFPAGNEAVRTVLAADEMSIDGRSNWVWLRLSNGDLILGVFPQGDTYFATEADHSRELTGEEP